LSFPTITADDDVGAKFKFDFSFVPFGHPCQLFEVFQSIYFFFTLFNILYLMVVAYPSMFKPKAKQIYF